MFASINISIDLILISLILSLFKDIVGPHSTAYANPTWKRGSNPPNELRLDHKDDEPKLAGQEAKRLLQQLISIETSALDKLSVGECNKWRSSNDELEGLHRKRHPGPRNFKEKCLSLIVEHEENMRKLKLLREKLDLLDIAEIKQISDIFVELESLKKIDSSNDTKFQSDFRSLLYPQSQNSKELDEKMRALERLQNIARASVDSKRTSIDDSVKIRLEELDLQIKGLIKQGLSLTSEQINILWDLYHEMNALIAHERNESPYGGLSSAYTGTLYGAVTLLVKWTEEVELPASEGKKSEQDEGKSENILISESPMPVEQTKTHPQLKPLKPIKKINPIEWPKQQQETIQMDRKRGESRAALEADKVKVSSTVTTNRRQPAKKSTKPTWK